MQVHVRAQHDGAGAVPVAGRHQHATAAAAVAGGDGGGERAVAVRRAADGRLHRGLLFKRNPCQYWLSWQVAAPKSVMTKSCARNVNGRSTRSMIICACFHGSSASTADAVRMAPTPPASDRLPADKPLMTRRRC